jgi:hypothetical protein
MKLEDVSTEGDEEPSWEDAFDESGDDMTEGSG